MKATELRYTRHGRRTLLREEPKQFEGALRVLVAEQVLLVDEGERARVVDFDRRRVLGLDRTNRTSTSWSLHGDVHDRVSGLHSALHVQAVLRAGGVAIGEPWQAAAGYGLTVAEVGDPPPLDREVDGDEILWRLGGLDVARYRPAGASLTPRASTRFLAHATRMHPLVRAAIVDEGRVPALLRHHSHFALNLVEETLTLESIAEVDFDLDALTQANEPGPALDEIAGLARHRVDAPTPGSRHLDAARKLIAEKRDLEAALAVLAHTLVSVDSDGVADLLRVISARSHWWSAVTRLIDAVTGTAAANGDAKAQQRRIATFTKLRRKAGDYAHVLDVFTGEALHDLGDIEGAHASLGAALRRDPTLAGAWVSMGRVYLRKLEFAAAWDCWDQALAQCPRHPIMRDIHTWREVLPAEHPQFF